jgi:carboxypeptidase Taq
MYWDERVDMPAKAALFRGHQRAAIASRAHAHAVSADLERAIAAALDENPESLEAQAALAEFEHERRLPPEFVARQAETLSASRAAWSRARTQGDAHIFLPHLAASCHLAREEADLCGYDHEPYEALLSNWERGVTPAQIESLCTAIETVVGDRVRSRNADDAPSSDALRECTIKHAAALPLERTMLSALGFDWNRGHIDRCDRAFCICLGGDDVRIATRAFTDGTLSRLNSSIHEAGHGIYEQSFARLGVSPLLAHAPSHGMDESQSRMLEVLIGGSRSWWQHWHAQIAKTVTTDIPDVDTLVQAYRASEYDHQRVGSDELSYNLHIQLRFEIERALINGSLEAEDVPEAWRERMRSLLAIDVTDDVTGCLQDVHWSIGQWGYFPTYMLGNVYSAQLWATAGTAIPDLDDQIATTGGSAELLAWHDQHVYCHGRSIDARTIIERATGTAPSHHALIEHLTSRYELKSA